MGLRGVTELVAAAVATLSLASCTEPVNPDSTPGDNTSAAESVDSLIPAATPDAQAGKPAPRPGAASLAASPPTRVNPPAVKADRARTVKRIKTKNRVVFFTIDDGGVEEAATARLLVRKGIPVTAFLTEEYVSQNPEFYQGISKTDKQVIQNHTVTHPQLPLLNLAGQEAEICGANRWLSDLYGKKPWLLRPPYGESNATTEVAARNCGLDYVVLWTINMPEGGKGRFQYSQGDELAPGDIILAHWRPNLHQDLKRALREIRRQGFQVAALQNYLPRVQR
ncbi:MAG: polysaccharide deacetylase family protein [Actinomycetia bacterium]|nr:polysaccharide deacetylase family protein [Actinomycetes bacterium]